MVATAQRTIRKVPALFVALLKDADKLPPAPTEVDRSVFGFRAPNLKDMMDLEWLAQWHGLPYGDKGEIQRVTGLIAYRDCYDFHSASDVRDIVYAAGSPRAIVNLLRWTRGEAALLNRRVIGSIDRGNKQMVLLLERMGAAATRLVFEAR